MRPSLSRAFGIALTFATIASLPCAAFAAAPAAMPTGTFSLATVGRIVASPDSKAGFGITLAPTPNPTVSAPLPLDADSRAPAVAPGLFHAKKTYNGEGFLSGSTVQDQEQRRAGPTPGISLKVPLD